MNSQKIKISFSWKSSPKNKREKNKENVWGRLGIAVKDNRCQGFFPWIFLQVYFNDFLTIDTVYLPFGVNGNQVTKCNITSSEKQSSAVKLP